MHPNDVPPPPPPAGLFDDTPPPPPPPQNDVPPPPPPPEITGPRSGLAVYLGADTETGGLDQRIHPLLSIASIVADGQMNRIDGMSFKIKPPPDTWLEVPITAHMFLPEKQKLTIDHYRNVYDGSVCAAADFQDRANRFIITAIAAETNGFILPTADRKWDLESYKLWVAQGLDIDTVDRALVQYVETASKHKLTGVAHNASFDEKFVTQWLPLFRQRFARPSEVVLNVLGFNQKGQGGLTTYAKTGWICTMELLRAWYKARGGEKGGAKLSDLAQLAGVTNVKAHDAFADTVVCLKGLQWLSQRPEWHHP